MRWSPTQRLNAALVGIGETSVGRHEGVGSLDMAARVAADAVRDAGLSWDDVDGLICGGSLVDDMYMYNARLAERLGIKPSYASVVPVGGTAFCHGILEGAAVIAARLAKTVLVVAADPLLSALPGSAAIDRFAAFQDPVAERPFGFTMPAVYAMAARRHMHVYGTTREQLAAVAVAARRHASLNPLAQFRDPLTVDEVVEAKQIASPLGLYDCSPVSDGGGAFIITAGNVALNCAKPPVYVLGGAESHTLEFRHPQRDITYSAAVETGQKLFRATGLSPADVDFVELYDCFTITVLVTLEDLGFCAKGEGGEFVTGGTIEIGGALPVNTHGGLLSHGHPGTPAGIFHVIEAVKQLRREVEPQRTVQGARVALVHGNAGMLRDSCGVLLSVDPLQ